MLAITSGGAIPDNADYRVILEPEDTFIGTVNEDFAVESIAGDIFQLGNISWRILRVQQGTVRVEDAHGQPPSIPFWLGEAPARSDELSAAVSELRASRCGWRSRGSEASEGSCRRAARSTLPLGMTAAARRRAAAGRVPRRIPPHARRAPDPGHPRRRAILRRSRRHAARDPRPVREPSEPRLGARPSQALLPPVQLRAPGGRDRGRAAALAGAAALVPAGERLPVPPSRHRAKTSWCRRCSTRRCSAPTGGGTPTIALAMPRSRAAGRCRLRSSGWRRRICSPPPSRDAAACLENIPGDREIPDHPLVRQTIDDCVHEVMDLDGLIAAAAADPRGRDPSASPAICRSRRRWRTRS